jgi:hypothetical protein
LPFGSTIAHASWNGIPPISTFVKWVFSWKYDNEPKMILLTFSPEFPSRTVKVRYDVSGDGDRSSSLHVTIFPDLWGDYIGVVGGRHLLNSVTMGNELGDGLVDQSPLFALVLKEPKH